MVRKRVLGWLRICFATECQSGLVEVVDARGFDVRMAVDETQQVCRCVLVLKGHNARTVECQHLGDRGQLFHVCRAHLTHVMNDKC